MVDDNTLDEMEPANRLELAYDQENKLKGSQEKVNLSTVKDSLYKSLYVKTKYSEDKVSEIDFMMDKMTMIGEKSHDMLYHLNPEHVNPRIEKQPEEKTKKEKKSNMVLPSDLRCPTRIAHFPHALRCCIVRLPRELGIRVPHSFAG